jgi:hypothetical protein
MEEINKFLTEAMGKSYIPAMAHNFRIESNPWGWFGELWEWAIEQKWWAEFLMDYVLDEFRMGMMINCVDYSIPKELINPERFAKAVYDFLND